MPIYPLAHRTKIYLRGPSFNPPNAVLRQHWNISLRIQADRPSL